MSHYYASVRVDGVAFRASASNKAYLSSYELITLYIIDDSECMNFGKKKKKTTKL